MTPTSIRAEHLRQLLTALEAAIPYSGSDVLVDSRADAVHTLARLVLTQQERIDALEREYADLRATLLSLDGDGR